ncbi:MAG: SemiSWEET transporter [Acidobacteriaceae bacterium]|jgi:MtN3 and saliva related transmembrane protein|nr:SemiSWEET transporter [Acidobacteriaceae bacterium]
MMRKSVIDMIGYVAAVCTTISFLPQLVRVLKLRSARDISLGMFILFSTGTALWLTYGILSHSWPVAGANLVTFGLSIAILILKLKYDAAYDAEQMKDEQ